jgi:hypothetical protein
MREVLGLLGQHLAGGEHAERAVAGWLLHCRRQRLTGGAGGARQALRVARHVAYRGGEGARGRLAIGEAAAEVGATEIGLRRWAEPLLQRDRRRLERRVETDDALERRAMR